MRKRLLSELIIIILAIITATYAYAEIEDFNSSDWVKADNFSSPSQLTWISSTLTFLDAKTRSHDSYIYRDFGAGNLTAFAYNFEFTVNNLTSTNAKVTLFGVSNEIGVLNNSSTGFHIYLRRGNNTIGLTAAGLTSKSVSVPSGTFTRYCTVERYGNIASLKMWEDPSRSGEPDAQLNTFLNSSDGYQYLYAFSNFNDNNSNNTFTGSIANYEVQAAPTDYPDDPTVQEVSHPYPADWDYKGGYKGITSQKRKFFKEKFDFADHFIVYDSNADFPTISEDGYDLAYLAFRPNANRAFNFVIRSNTDKYLFIMWPDRIEYPVISEDDEVWAEEGSIANGNFETNGGWVNYNTPTINEQSITGTSIFGGIAQWHFAGDADDGVEVENFLAIDQVEDDCITVVPNWDDMWKAVGHIKVISGTVKMQVIDGNGTTSILNTQIGTTNGKTIGGEKIWESFYTSDFKSNHTGSCGQGKVRFYCSGGPCRAYLDNLRVGQVHTGTGLNTPISMSGYLDDFVPYIVYHDWDVQYFADRKRFYLINPLGNVYFFKGANNMDFNQIKGRSGIGYGSPCTAYKSRIGSSLGCTAVSANKLNDLNELGITDFGFISAREARDIVVSPDSKMNIIRAVDMKQGSSFWREDGTAGFFNTIVSDYNNDWVDVYDPDYRRQVKCMIDGLTDACVYGWYSNDVYFNSPNADYDNYKYGRNRVLANINIIGWMLGNEPTGSGAGYRTPMYRLMQTNWNATDSTDENFSETFIAQINWLRTHYGDPDAEGTFLNNIGYSGEYELAVAGSVTGPTADNWSDVPGYDATDSDADGTPDKDEEAMQRLIAAWSGSWGTYAPPDPSNASWNQWIGFYENGVVGSNSGMVADMNENPYSGPDQDFYDDLDDMLANYQHRFHLVLYDEWFAPEAKFHDRRLNFGFGHSLHRGWARGWRVRSDGKKIIKVAAGPGTSTDTSDGPAFITPFQDFSKIVRKGVTAYDNGNRYYMESGGYDGPGQGVPMFGSSMWYTGEMADQFGKSGTVDLVFTTTGTNGDFRFGAWSCTGLTADVNCAVTDSSLRIPAGTTVGFNCTDNTDLETCADTGVIVYHWVKALDQPEDRSEFNNMIWWYANPDSIGNMASGDILTDGTRMLALSGTGTRRSAIVDWDQYFYPVGGFKSRYVLANGFNWTIFYNLSDQYGTNGHVVDADPDDGQNVTRYYMLLHETSPHSVSPYKSFDRIAGYQGSTWTNFNTVFPGDDYQIGFMSADGKYWPDQFYIMDTQEKRAKGYIRAIKDRMDSTAENGDKFIVGQSLWAIISDYGWSDYTTREVRGFGAWTAKANKKDGIENTTLGADGIEGTGDDEERDNMGNFTYLFEKYLDEIYLIHD